MNQETLRYWTDYFQRDLDRPLSKKYETMVDDAREVPF
jgi:hypothetical protein